MIELETTWPTIILCPEASMSTSVIYSFEKVLQVFLDLVLKDENKVICMLLSYVIIDIL